MEALATRKQQAPLDGSRSHTNSLLPSSFGQRSHHLTQTEGKTQLHILMQGMSKERRGHGPELPPHSHLPFKAALALLRLQKCLKVVFGSGLPNPLHLATVSLVCTPLQKLLIFCCQDKGSLPWSTTPTLATKWNTVIPPSLGQSVPGPPAHTNVHRC